MPSIPSILELCEICLIFSIISRLVGKSHFPLISFYNQMLNIYRYLFQQSWQLIILSNMSMQKLNIRLPERISLSQFTASKPCSPIPIPMHILNQVNDRPIDPVPINQSQSRSNGFVHQNHPNMNNQVVRNTYTPIPYYPQPQIIQPNIQYHMPAAQPPQPLMNTYAQHQMQSSFPNHRQQYAPGFLKPNMPVRSESPIPVNFKKQLHQKDHQSPQHSSPNAKIRPKSPKIEFKYVSPPKQSMKIEQMKEVSDSLANKQGNLDVSQSSSSKNNRYTEYKKQTISNSIPNNDLSEELVNLQNEIVNSSLKNSVPEKSTITNYIYTIENRKQKDYQQSLNLNFNQSQQKLPSNKNLLKKPKKSEDKNIQNQAEAHNNSNDRQLILKNHDNEINELLKQYETLKYYHDNDTSSNRLPRVSKNSSDDGSSRPSAISGIRSGGNSQIKNDPRLLTTFGVIDTHQLETKQKPDIPIRIKSDKNMKRQSISNMIKQDTIYVIQGVENVKSEEILDIDSLSNDTFEKHTKQSKLNQLWRQNQNETANTEFNYKLKQKQLEVKNLKNQVWLMKLRQNQLLLTIKKLQSITKDQQVLIDKLSKQKKQ